MSCKIQLSSIPEVGSSFNGKVICQIPNAIRTRDSIEPGAYEFPFEFFLPPDLPNSVERDHGSIRYSLTATVDVPFGFNYEEKMRISFQHPVDLNLQHEVLLVRGVYPQYYDDLIVDIKLIIGVIPLHCMAVEIEDVVDINNEAEHFGNAEKFLDEDEVSNTPKSPKARCVQEDDPQKPGCSKEVPEHFFVTLPSDIIPLPLLTKKRKRTKKGLKSTLLTSTPNKEQLEILEQEKRRKIELKKRKEAIRRNNTMVRNFFEEERSKLKENQNQSSSDSDVQMSLHDSSSDMNYFESDSELSSGSAGLNVEKFAVVKVYGKTKDS
ncbi:unnamed protein product [Psylliodes chrysocephalus]|uniref:Arrestin-like N-terminal domain-containing protein n=1 Tax=Psylliodes chrysocephalus TaxID=3402493 RepID=A0A9P0GDM7_9CUCU|nr:unnamed protein product [Psylliodes chrysocephala]